MIPVLLAIKLEEVELILTEFFKDYPVPESELFEGIRNLTGIINILDNNAAKLKPVTQIAENFRLAFEIFELRARHECSIKEIERATDWYFKDGVILLDDLLVEVSLNELQ